MVLDSKEICAPDIRHVVRPDDERYSNPGEKLSEHVLALLAPLRFLQSEIGNRIRFFPEIVGRLLRDAPILVMMLVYKRTEMLMSMGIFRTALSGRRTEICRLLGGSGTKSELKFLLKIKFDFLDEDAVRLGLKVLRNSRLLEAARLLNIKYADTFLVELLMDYPEAFICPAVRRPLERRYSVCPARKILPDEYHAFKDLACTARDTYRMVKDGKRAISVKRLQAITSPASLVRLHDELCTRREKNRYITDPLFKSDFGHPPLTGTETIVPITTYNELFNESREMHNCVFSYCHRIWEKNYYVYRMLAPQRATLGIIIPKDGRKRIDQVKLACNKSPSDETIAAVKEWFGKVSAGFKIEKP